MTMGNRGRGAPRGGTASTPRRGRSLGRIRSRGSALIVSLVFLVVLTLLGLSTMTTARLDLRMAANAQFANQAFQAAESGIDLTLATPSLKTLLSTDPASKLEQQHTVGGQNVDTATEYVTDGLAPGFSIGTPALHFRITSTATAPGGGEAVHVQGFYIIGAKAG